MFFSLKTPLRLTAVLVSMTTDVALSFPEKGHEFIGTYKTESVDCDELKYLGPVEKVVIKSDTYQGASGLEVSVVGSRLTESFKIRLGSDQSTFDYIADGNFVKSATRSWTTIETADSLDYKSSVNYGDRTSSENYVLTSVDKESTRFGYYFFDGIDRRDDRSVFAECTLRKIE